MKHHLLVGTSEIDITPNPETKIYLAGSLTPNTRPAQGILDPLYVRTIVLDNGEDRIAYCIFDLIALNRDMIEPYVKKASEQTGIPVKNIIWSCTHTHNGPVSIRNCYPSSQGQILNTEWLKNTLDKFVDSVSQALTNLRPAKTSRGRAFEYTVSHNRRIHFKHSNDINTWLLQHIDSEPQSLGSGPIDPELGILSFEDETGTLLAVIYQFTLHANGRGGQLYSADYPGVVAAKLKEIYGNQLIPLYMPGACGDINPIIGTDDIGQKLAVQIINQLEKRKPIDCVLPIGVEEKYLTVPYRNLDEDIEERLMASKWQKNEQQFFRETFQKLKDAGKTETDVLVKSWHIGEMAFTSIPGELFVEHGLKIKAESCFPWTYPVELSEGWHGYFITHEAWQNGAYEGLTTTAAPVSPEGVDMIIDQAILMLNRLAKKVVESRLFPEQISLKNGKPASLRPLRAGDSEALTQFYESIPKEDYCFYCPHPLDREHALKNTKNADHPNKVCLIMETEKHEIAGYAWYRWQNTSKSEFGICIRRDYHGVGAGKQLIQHLFKVAKQYGPPVMSLTVQKANAGAVILYQKSGFNIVREQLRASDQEEEYYMECDFRKSIF